MLCDDWPDWAGCESIPEFYRLSRRHLANEEMQWLAAALYARGEGELLPSARANECVLLLLLAPSTQQACSASVVAFVGSLARCLWLS